MLPTIGGGQSVRLEICRIKNKNYLMLPTADFERMSPPDASVHSSHCRATWWSAVLCGGGQLESARRVTQCAGSVRACAARGSEARGEEHCASCQLMRSGVMPPASPVSRKVKCDKTITSENC